MDELINETYLSLLPTALLKLTLSRLSYLDLRTHHWYLDIDISFWKTKTIAELEVDDPEVESKFDKLVGFYPNIYIRLSAELGRVVIGNTQFRGSDVLMCPVEMLKISADKYIRSPTKQGKDELYLVINLFADFVKQNDLSDISRFDYLYQHYLVDEIIYLISLFEDPPLMEEDIERWSFQGKEDKWQDLLSKMSEPIKTTYSNGNVHYQRFQQSNFQEVNLDYLCVAYRSSRTETLPFIISKIEDQSNADKLYYYAKAGLKDLVWEILPKVEHDVDCYYDIFLNFAEDTDIALIQNLYLTIVKESSKQIFIRMALEYTNYRSEIFSWALELFDPNFIKCSTDLFFIVVKSYEDIRGLIQIKEKIETLATSETLTQIIKSLTQMKGKQFFNGHQPLLKYLFEER